MIKAYSQRITPPYSGQVQIAESNRARALTMDGETWEIQFLYATDGQSFQRRYRRVAHINYKELLEIPKRSPEQLADVDERIVELADFLATARLPFPATDRFEYWLLDHSDGSPLALIFSCTEAAQMESYPHRPEWTATPASIMKVARLPEEEQSHYVPPVNYRLEQLVKERAGKHPRARWIKRRDSLTETFPACLVREDWGKEEDQRLCQRYIERQAPRLLMLHGLEHEDRLRLEGYARQNALEVERFFHLYPAVADEKVISAIRVEARLRLTAGDTQNSFDY